MSNDFQLDRVFEINQTVIYKSILQIEEKQEFPNEIVSGIAYNPDPIYPVQFTWQNTNGTLFSHVLEPRSKFKFNRVSLRSITNTTDQYANSFTGNVSSNLQLRYPTYQQVRSPLYIIYVSGNNELPFDIVFERTRNNKSSVIYLLSGTFTSGFTMSYFPESAYIDYTMHITSISGTSPSLQINITPVSPVGTNLSGVNLYTKTYTATGDDFQIINVNQLDQINILGTESGTSPSFTLEMTLRG
jgi:hypothetical protein